MIRKQSFSQREAVKAEGSLLAAAEFAVAGSRACAVLWESPNPPAGKTKSFPLLGLGKSAGAAREQSAVCILDGGEFKAAGQGGNRWWQVGGRPSASRSAPSRPGNPGGGAARREARCYRPVRGRPRPRPPLTARHLEGPAVPEERPGGGGGSLVTPSPDQRAAYVAET